MPLNFRDTSIAFKAQSTRSLQRSKWIFFILSKSSLVRIGKGLTMAAFSLRIPINYLILKTVFKQFCGGQTVSDSKNVISKNWKYHVASILDYSVEGQIDKLGFDQTQKSIIETIDLAKNNSGVPLAVFKVTGLVKASLLQKVSSGMNLTKDDLASWEKGLERIDEILAHAYSLDVPIMIDAEESWIQNAVDDIARKGMELYNKKDVIVYNTIQCYKIGQLSLLKKNIDQSIKADYLYGVKLVRGAYMEKENSRAKKMGYKSPIQPSKYDTDKEFNECIKYVLKIIGSPAKKKGIGLIIGTHNEESTILAANTLKNLGWENNEAPVWFAQLYGMSDNISFNLANNGYKTAKYLPFGPIKEVIPYLFRRAEENTSVEGQTGRELSLINQELLRRQEKKI
jgi:proline dehydrogenase